MTLWALGRILDAENDASDDARPDRGVHGRRRPTTGTDVRGVNITMFAGLGGGVRAASGSPEN